jgi:hypothetical protein
VLRDSLYQSFSRFICGPDVMQSHHFTWRPAEGVAHPLMCQQESPLCPHRLHELRPTVATEKPDCGEFFPIKTNKESLHQMAAFRPDEVRVINEVC